MRAGPTGRELCRDGLGAWPTTPTTPITTIHVSQLGSFGSTLMRASEEGVAALGHVLPALELIQQLQARVADAAIPIEYDTLITLGESDAHSIRLEARAREGDARQAIETPLVLCCEGSVRAERGAQSASRNSSSMAPRIRWVA